MRSARKSFSLGGLGRLGRLGRLGTFASFGGLVGLVSLAFLGSLALLGAEGCATLLGFDDTTLRADEGGIGSDGSSVIDATPGGEGGTSDGGSKLTVKPSALVLRRGGTTGLEIDLARGSDVPGPVTAHLTGLPAGVTATTATIAATASSGTLTLTTGVGAKLGASTAVVTTDAPSLSPLNVPLLVADAPGALDTTFDTDGLVSDGTKGLGSTYFALAVQSDQKIVAGGAFGPAAQAPSGWLLDRFAANGAPDSAFDAQTSMGLPADGEVHALAIGPGGTLICAGESSTGAPLAKLQLTVARFTSAGKLDTAFGTGGLVRLPASEAAGGSVGLGVAVDSSGAVVVVGSRKDLFGTETGVITRFESDGTRDATFNGGITVTVPSARFVGVSIEATGSVVAAGSTIAGSLPSYVLARRTAAGANDPTFGTAGTASFGNTYRANAFARLPDGSLAVIGDVQQGAPGYTAGVTSGAGNAVFARAYANATGAGFFGIGVQGDGRIIAAGHTAVVSGEARVERILPDGNKDISFNDGGTVIIEPAGAASGFDVTLFAAAVQPDGRILTAGNRTTVGAVIYRLWP